MPPRPWASRVGGGSSFFNVPVVLWFEREAKRNTSSKQNASGKNGHYASSGNRLGLS